MSREKMRDAIAQIISPEWFGDQNGKHVLDNYPGQHKVHQERARAKAIDIIDFLAGEGHLT